MKVEHGVGPIQSQKIAETKAIKAAYVKRQGQTRSHTCHFPGCGKQCPPAMWGCKSCWFKLPRYLRDKVWATYRVGQEVTMTPSKEYIKVVYEVEQWILDNLLGGS